MLQSLSGTGLFLFIMVEFSGATIAIQPYTVKQCFSGFY